jgi:hypothetical protein
MAERPFAFACRAIQFAIAAEIRSQLQQKNAIQIATVPTRRSFLLGILNGLP